MGGILNTTERGSLSHSYANPLQQDYCRLLIILEIAEPDGSLDAENACVLASKFIGGASDLDVSPKIDNPTRNNHGERL